MERSRQREEHRKKCSEKKIARVKTLKVFEEEKECQGVWDVVNKGKKAMRR